jgi:hypothetical protein
LRQGIVALGCALGAAGWGNLAFAQFSTVINVPPDAAPASIGSSTQLNLGDGGTVFSSSSSPFFIGMFGVVSTNVELNVTGGVLESHAEAFAGSTVNISGGRVLSDFEAYDGSTINISGGIVDQRLLVREGAQAMISGGRVDVDFSAGGIVSIAGGTVERMSTGSGSLVGISGGVIGPIHVSGMMNVSGGAVGRQFETGVGADVKLVGNEFRLNGVLVPGLGAAGDSVPVNVPEGAVLSGTLSDGTPIVFSSWNDDEIFAGTMSLVAADLPAIGPAVIDAATEPVPLGIRQGQTLLVTNGAVVERNFNAGRGSVVTVQAGGTLGFNFEGVNATVNVNGGSTADMRIYDGSVLTITNGSTVGNVLAIGGSTLHLSGGEANFIDVIDGSTLNITGGTAVSGGFNAQSGSTANISAGEVRDIARALDGSVVNVSGGSVGNNFRAFTGSAVRVTGGSIGDFFTAENSCEVAISGGTFGDAFNAHSGSDITLLGGEFAINGTPVAGLDTVGAVVQVNLPPAGLLSGTLADGTPVVFSLSDGDALASGALRLQAAALPAPGPALINLPGAAAPRGLRAGQTLVVGAGGVVGKDFVAGPGSAVTLEPGGAIGANFEAVGADVEVLGGTMGASFDAFAGADVDIFSGTIGGNLTAHEGSVVNLYGGAFGAGIRAAADSRLIIHGSEFLLNGSPIAGLIGGEPFLLTARTGTLSARLLDGSSLSIPLAVMTRPGPTLLISPDAELLLVPVPEPSGVLLACCGVAGLRLARRRRQMLRTDGASDSFPL